MQLLTDEAREQLSQGVSVVLGGLFAISVLLFLVAIIHAPVVFVLHNGLFGVDVPGRSTVFAVSEWLWTDQTPAYFVASIFGMLFVYVNHTLAQTTDGSDSAAGETEEQDQLQGLSGTLSELLKLTFGANTILVFVLSGAVAGVVVSKTPVASLAVAVAFLYPVADAKVSKKTKWIPTPVTIGTILSIPLAVLPVLYTVPIYACSILSKRFASVVISVETRLLSIVNRVTDAVPELDLLQSRLSPRRP